MKSDKLRCNRFYWSRRYEKPCICESYMGFMAYVIFLDKKNSGWYHCQELEEMDLDKRQNNWCLHNCNSFHWHNIGASKSYLLLSEERWPSSMKQTLFIEAEGRIWVPQPSSWLGGWTRHRWLERHFGRRAPLSIASPHTWHRLASENNVKVLTEENNSFTESNSWHCF